MLTLPWGSLVAMQFSDPETKPSSNELADPHMQAVQLLITKSNSSSQGGIPSFEDEPNSEKPGCFANTASAFETVPETGMSG